MHVGAFGMLAARYEGGRHGRGGGALRAALEPRDQLHVFSSLLESRKDDGTLSTAEYATGRTDYGSRSEARTRRVHALKAALGKELEPSERDADMRRLKPERTEVQREARELSAATFDPEWQR